MKYFIKMNVVKVDQHWVVNWEIFCQWMFASKFTDALIRVVNYDFETGFPFSCGRQANLYLKNTQ